MNSHLTIETAFLEKLALKLHCKEVLTHLTLRPNPTLFDSGKEYHYEARPQNSITRCYTVESTPILKAIVRLLKTQFIRRAIYRHKR